jgi:hypothetical protein
MHVFRSRLVLGLFFSLLVSAMPILTLAQGSGT